jgi:hypothetical protein
MTQGFCDAGGRNRTALMQILLIHLALSALVLGATIKVDNHLPRVGTSGPEDSDTNSSSGIASMRSAGTIQPRAGN